jgi:hypothetical protein
VGFIRVQAGKHNSNNHSSLWYSLGHKWTHITEAETKKAEAEQFASTVK